MDNKLTLKLDNQVIERAKIYAQKKNTSLSKLIEAYLKFLTSSSSADTNEVTPLVKSLSGVIKSSNLSDIKESYKKHLTKKYAK
jgi:hypothetical protein